MPDHDREDRDDEGADQEQIITSPNLNTVYVICGFRSLRDFKIVLKPGLNVLVGPNGSGKTNFIDFLDFIDNTLRAGASAAVSSAGGVARVFSLEDMKRSSPSVVAKISAVAELPDVRNTGIGTRIFNFDYEIEIKFSRTHSAIYIAREFIRIKKLRTPDEDDLANSVVGVISHTRRSPLDEEIAVQHVGARLHANSPRNPLHVLRPYAAVKTPSDAIKRLDPTSSPDESLLLYVRGIPAIEAIRSAITRGRSYNINPARARQADDVTRSAIIQRDGSGVSATLHEMQQARRSVRPPIPHSRRPRITPDSLDSVITWTKLVFPELEDITVAHDPHTGKYLVHLVVGPNRLLKIPLQAASDGTVKWLSFVCLIVAAGVAYSIEEPENFLHPKMQQFLVQMIRESLTVDHRGGYCIISTHSETLINECFAEELILFRFDGQTRCERLRDPARVRAVINETGFGLGYYYASNAIS